VKHLNRLNRDDEQAVRQFAADVAQAAQALLTDAEGITGRTLRQPAKTW
jgi:hypothetical protein